MSSATVPFILPFDGDVVIRCKKNVINSSSGGFCSGPSEGHLKLVALTLGKPGRGNNVGEVSIFRELGGRSKCC